MIIKATFLIAFQCKIKFFHVFNCRRYHQLLTLVPSDPGVLSKLGELYDSENEKSQAFHYFYEVNPL